MIKPMKLKGIIQKDNDALTFHGTLHDNSPFSVNISEHDVVLNEPFTHEKNRVDGWLFIQQEAQQDNRVYVTLPKPSLQHGHHVLVHEYQLMPREASLADFGAQKKPKGQTFPQKQAKQEE